ncbi:restriction endonuclease [Lysobacter pythonis]|uniref:Restriction endonuclease n=1 Tax=Solilutibacter pythonis TaxID=2483112 RepID=A0A3M2HSZ8_9GAMM|nr:BsuBI/PstI family type II restriction endonuclease [Lysobacter pythonis]RMH92886.1 restriction endonuclease [Lysobacter pythonis]
MRRRIDQAKCILALLNMPRAQRNDRTAYILLALSNLRPNAPWANADGADRWRTVDIMQWLRDHYDKDYAPNSRETLRRFSLHPMIEAGLVLYNPDDPARPVNSPDNCYQISPEALALVRQFGSKDWNAALTAFLKVQPGLAAKYGKARDLAQVPVAIPGGQLALSPGAHSELIRDIIERFAPRFVRGAILLYVGDTGDKHGYFDRDALAALGVVVDDHGKLPDVVLHDVGRNWLILAEAASSHGPVDAKRHGELARLFANSTAGLVYVSAFPSRAIMRKYLADIAWETEAWAADEPDHLTHFDGERFLGPYA